MFKLKLKPIQNPDILDKRLTLRSFDICFLEMAIQMFKHPVSFERQPVHEPEDDSRVRLNDDKEAYFVVKLAFTLYSLLYASLAFSLTFSTLWYLSIYLLCIYIIFFIQHCI